jgi:hypothetical protein
MIKARGTYAGAPLILLGLSYENVARLFADEPIVVRTSRPAPDGIGLDGGPVIGPTEDAIMTSMRQAGISPDIFHDDRPQGGAKP